MCNTGWSGPDCATAGDLGLPPAPSHAGSIAGGLIGGILGGAILLAVGLFVKAKVRRTCVWAGSLLGRS